MYGNCLLRKNMKALQFKHKNKFRKNLLPLSMSLK